MADGQAAFLIDGSWKIGFFQTNCADHLEDFALAYVPARLSACATWLASSIAGALLRQGGSDGSNPLLGAWLRRLCPAWLYPRHMWQGRWPGLRVVARQAPKAMPINARGLTSHHSSMNPRWRPEFGNPMSHSPR